MAVSSKTKLLLIFFSAFYLMYGCAAKSPKLVSAVGSDDGALNVYVIDGVLSFQGASADIGKKYPYSSEIINATDENGIKPVLALYTQNMCKSEPKNFTLALDKKSGDCVFDLIDLKGKPFAPALSVTISRENFSVMQVGSKYKVMAMLNAQILAMDMVSSSIIASIPIYITTFDSVDTREQADDKEYRKKLINGILTEDLPELVNKEIANMVIKRNPKKRIAVSSVTIDQMKPDSRNRLDKHEDDINAYKVQVANTFTQMFSNRLHVPFLPYQEDAAIGAMTLSFARSSDTSSFQIPKADYGIDINIQGYRVKHGLENKYKFAVYATFVNIVSKQIYTGQNIFNNDISSASVNPNVVSFLELDERDALYRSMRELAYEFVENIYNPTSKWIKISVHGDKKNVKKELKDLSILLDECR